MNNTSIISIACLFVFWINSFVGLTQKAINENVALINYQQIEEVKEFEKMEIGVTPKPVYGVKISRFVNSIDGEKLNPFLEWE